MKNREEFQSDWEKIVDLGFSSYRNLNRAQRIWFNIERLTTDGLWSYFVNAGGAHNKDVLEDLITLGFPNVAQMVSRLNKLFPPLVIGSVWRVSQCVALWPDGKHDEVIEAVDSEFWDVEPKLSKALLAYINDHATEICT